MNKIIPLLFIVIAFFSVAAKSDKADRKSQGSATSSYGGWFGTAPKNTGRTPDSRMAAPPAARNPSAGQGPAAAVGVVTKNSELMRVASNPEAMASLSRISQMLAQKRQTQTQAQTPQKVSRR